MVGQLLGICELLGLTFSTKINQSIHQRDGLLKTDKKIIQNNSSCLGLLVI